MSNNQTIGVSRSIFHRFSNFRMNKETQSNNKTNKSADSILNDSGNLK